MGVGIAVIQPAMPTLSQLWMPNRVPLATAAYGNGMLIGETLAAAITIPLLLPAFGWRGSLVVWSLIPLATAAVIPFVAAPAPALTPHPVARRVTFRGGPAPRLGLLQGAASTIYFSSAALMPTYLHAVGRGGQLAATLTALNAAQLAAPLALPVVGRRPRAQGVAYVAAGAGSAVAIVAFLATPHVVIAAGVIGFFSALSMLLTLALPPQLVPAREVPRASAGMFTIGYAMAFALPLLGAGIWDATGLPRLAFVPAAASAVALILGSRIPGARRPAEAGSPQAG